MLLDEDKRLNVAPGDYVGFSWKYYGVIMFDFVDDDNYVGAKVKPEVGKNYTFDSRAAHREYAIKYHIMCGEL